MFLTKKALPRRTFLRGMGATVALPFLDAMVPALSARALKPTPRFGFVYIANGVIQNQWTPATTGAGFELTPTLQPFANVRDKITVLSGLSHLQADTFGDGTGDHPRASAVWLTGVHAYDRTTAGRRSEARHHGRSAHRPRDRQDVADPVDRDVRRFPDAGVLRFRRLLLREHRLVAQRDDAEQHRIASADPVRAAVRRRRQRRGAPGPQPVRGEHSRFRPRRGQPRGQQSWPRRQAPSCASTSTPSARSSSGFRTPRRSPVDIALPERPTDIPSTFDAHTKLMFDLQALAFQADITRVFSMIMSRELSTMTFASIGVPEQHHGVSHHRNDPKLIAKKARIDLYQAQLFAYFLEKLQSMPEGDGSILDQSLLLYGGGMGDGNMHRHSDLPTLLAGGLGGKFKMGRHLQVQARHADDQPAADDDGQRRRAPRQARRQHGQAARTAVDFLVVRMVT